MANKNQQTKEKESGKMLKEKLFFVCMLMWAICMGGLALGQNQTCPFCGQDTVVEVVYGKPDKKLLEREKHGEIILGGEVEQEEKCGCRFCHRYIEPYLERVRLLLAEHPERKFEPKAIYESQGDLRMLKGWECDDALNVRVENVRVKFRLQGGYAYHAIPLLTPTEKDFWLYVIHKQEDLEIYEYLRKNLYTKMFAGFYIEDKLKKAEPDWDYIMVALHCLAAVPEMRFVGTRDKDVAFSAVKSYLRDKKLELSVQEGDYRRADLPEERRQYQLARSRFREVCDLEMADAPQWLALSIRDEKLQFDAPAYQNPDERKALIKDIRQYLETEFNADCSCILIRLLADECHSAQDLEVVGKELERYLENPACTGMSDEFACCILLKACVYEPKTAIRWTDKIVGMLLNENRIEANLKNVPKAQKPAFRKQIKQSVGNIYSQTYRSCWRTGDYDTAERWMAFCGDMHTRHLLANAKEHLKLLRSSNEYFAFVRNDTDSPLRRALADQDIAAVKAIMKTTDDVYLRAEAALQLGGLLLRQGRTQEAKSVLWQWPLPLDGKGHVALDLHDLTDEMQKRRTLLLTRNAIAAGDVACLGDLACGWYSSPDVGEARRLGMKYLRENDPMRYERGKAYLVRAQGSLSYGILDFEDGLQEKSFPREN